MASKRIAGITIEIGGDASKLNKALAGVDKTLSQTATKLKDINNLLKLNPGNSDLLIQKQKALATEINSTKQRLAELKNAQQNALTTEQWDKLQSELKETETNITGLKQKLDELKSVQQGSVTAEQWDKLQAEIKETETELTQAKQKLAELKSVQQSSVTPENWDALQREIIETETKLKGLETEHKNFGSVATQQIQAVGEKLKAVGDSISTFGGKVKDAGSNLTTHLSLPLAAVGAAGVKSFAEVDKTMTLTNNTMKNSESEAKMLSQAMKDAASNSTYGMKDAAEATLNFARAGLDAQQAADTLAPAMNLAAGEGGNLDTVSAGLVATINGFHGTFDQAGQYADVFAAACNNSALDVDSLSSSMSIAAPVFSSAGYTVKDAAAYLGIMANQGIDANKAATSLKTGLSRLVAPAKQGGDMMDKLGISVTNADGSMKGADLVVAELHDKFKDLSESEQIAAASAIFGKNQMAPWLALINAAPEDVGKLYNELSGASLAIDSFTGKLKENGVDVDKVKKNLKELGVSNKEFEMALNSSGGNAEKFAYNLESMTKEGVDSDEIIKALGGDLGVFQTALDQTAGTTESMANAMMSGFGGSLEKLKSSIDVAVTSLGEALAPTISAIAEKIQQAVDWFNSLNESQQQMIAKVGLVVAAIGPALAIVGTVIGAIGGIISAIGTVLVVGAPLIAGIGAVLAALGPVGLVIGAVVAAGVLLYKNWDTIKEKATEVWNAVKETVSKVWEGIKAAVSEKMEAIKSFISNAWNNIKTGVTNVLNAIKTTVSNVWNAIKTAITTVLNGIKTVITTVWKAYTTLIQTELNLIKTVVTTVWNAIKTVVTTVLNTIKTVITTAWNAIKTTVTTVVNALKTAIQTAWNGIKSVVESVGNAIKTTVTNAWNAIKTAVVNAVTNMKTALKTKWDEIKQQVKNIFTADNFIDLGKNIVTGIISGITKKAKDLYDSLKNLASEALSAAKKKLKSNSPSKLFRDEVGQWIPAGIAVGIDKNLDYVTSALDNMVNTMVPEVNSALSGTVPGSAMTGNTTTTNYGGVTINVNAQDGQSAREIAQEVSYILNTQVAQQRAVYA